MPLWLVFNTLKRKNRAISLDDFNFSQLTHVKPKGTKKAKTLSKVMVDKSKNKYVEMEISPLDIDLDKFQPTNYVINRIDMGKQTHEVIVEYAQASFHNLVTSYNEEKIKKDKLKRQVEQLTDILIKITKSSEVIELVASLVVKQIIKQVE